MDKLKIRMGFALLAFSALLLVACHATPTTESTGEYLDDSVITTKVKTALMQDKAVKSNHISVETFKGMVQLSGFVADQQQVTQAGAITLKVPGVKRVKNNLIIKNSPS